MPTATYEPITTVTATGGSSILVMSSIPQTYTDLVLVVNGDIDVDDEFRLRFNSDAGSNYRVLFLYASSGGVSSSEYVATNYVQLGGLFTSGTATGSNMINIFNYSNTTINKTVVNTSNSGNYTQFRNNTWRSTSAITQIDAYTASGGIFSNPTTFTLYGIKAA